MLLISLCNGFKKSVLWPCKVLHMGDFNFVLRSSDKSCYLHPKKYQLPQQRLLLEMGHQQLVITNFLVSHAIKHTMYLFYFTVKIELNLIGGKIGLTV